MKKPKALRRYPNTNSIVTFNGRTWRVAKYVVAFPNSHVELDPVDNVGETFRLPLDQLHRLEVTE